jgi:hypothetical protein
LVTSTIVDAGGGALKYSRRYRKTIGGTEVVSFHNSPRTRCNGVTVIFAPIAGSTEMTAPPLIRNVPRSIVLAQALAVTAALAMPLRRFWPRGEKPISDLSASPKFYFRFVANDLDHVPKILQSVRRAHDVRMNRQSHNASRLG